MQQISRCNLTKIAKKPPRAIAEAIVENIDKESAIYRSNRYCGPWIYQHHIEKRLFARSRESGA